MLNVWQCYNVAFLYSQLGVRRADADATTATRLALMLVLRMLVDGAVVDFGRRRFVVKSGLIGGERTGNSDILMGRIPSCAWAKLARGILIQP